MGRTIAAVLILALCSASPALATTRTVTNNNDSGAGSLRQAILDADAANTGDTIEFGPAVTSQITLTSGVLEIQHSLTITGPGSSSLAISGGNESQVFIVDSSATVSISGLTIEDGTSTDSGGAIENFGALTLTGSTVSGSSADSGNGGGIENEGTLTMSSGIVSGNSAEAGGGIDNANTLTVTNSVVSGNSATDAGSGINNENSSTLTVSNSTLSGNTSPTGVGGGIENDGSVTVTRSTISENSSPGAGGIDNLDILTVINSTFSGNSTTGGNGGAIREALGTVTVVNSTISSNSAGTGSGGGIYVGFGATAIVKNTIVANNPTGGNCQSSGSLTSEGHNLSDDKTCSGGFTAASDLNDTAAGLDSAGLKDNGGTTDTIALLNTSPAVLAVPTSPTNYCTEVDGTTVITTDQRGDPRPAPGQTSCDIGAYEYQPTPTPVSGKLKVSPKTLKFGIVTVNQPKVKTVTITNAGKNSKKNHPLPILIEMETTSGMPTPSPFSVTTQCDDYLMPHGKSVAESETMCKVAVQFMPTQAVSYSGTLTIFDNLEPSEMQTVQMTGNGKPAK